MTPSLNNKPTAIDQSEEQQALAYQFTKEAASGTISPELKDKLFSFDLITRSEKFRALQIIAIHNIPAKLAADKARADLAKYGYSEDSVPSYVLHPVLLRLDSYESFGQTVWTYAIDEKLY